MRQKDSFEILQLNFFTIYFIKGIYIFFHFVRCDLERTNWFNFGVVGRVGVGGCIHILWVNECGWRHIFHGCGWGNIFYGWVDGYILGGWCWVDVLYGCVGMSGDGSRCILDGWVWEMVSDGNETGHSFSYNPIYNSFFILLLGSRSTKHRVLEKSRLFQMWQQFFFFFKFQP